MKNSAVQYGLLSIIFFMVVSCHKKEDVPVLMPIHNQWQFKQENDTVWRSAIVPGNVHSDLLKNQLIENPFIKDNALKLQWISDSNWEYRTSFKIDKKTLQKHHIELSFKGLDTYASIYLNDSLIVKTNNAFREFNIDVKTILRAENELHIFFEKTITYEEKEKSKLSYSLPEGNRIFTRKPQFQYGWDWGPELNTFGIWKPVELKAWNDFKIEDVFIKQMKLNDSVADLYAEINFRSDQDRELNYKVYINDSLSVENDFNTSWDSLGIAFQIKNPKWWWPHNLGTPYLYNIKVIVRDNKSILDSISIKKGLRTITLVHEEDTIGESFYFKVNGVPVFAKGANYIPQNSMQNHVTDKHYKKLLEDVVNANMNMLRVWGGGLYEDDLFYDLCDEKGILIWQDFMFACAMYPGDEAFLKNVEAEAEQQVKRLRNHSAIALWCGNNESSEGWHRWGWQIDRDEDEKEEIWRNYLKIFDSILPNTVTRFSETDYWESSPKYGRGNPKYEFEGDAHDWWIWHDAYPFEHLEEHVPRFMSEFGFQSFPSYEVIKYINQNDSIEIASKTFKTHQKHARGFQLIKDYMQRDFPIPKHAEDYIYVSQLLQAYGICKGIEAQRRAKPYNMGTLYWQLNDCWPVISWSSIDFLGNWKALHYKAKQSFADVLVSSKISRDTLKTYLVNDQLKDYSGELEIKVIDFFGNVIQNITESIQIEPNSSEIKHELDLNALRADKRKIAVVQRFRNQKKITYLVKPKALKLEPQTIQKSITKTRSGFEITLRAKSLQKDVFLFCNEKGHFSDNYFDLLPNETRVIEFHTNSLVLDDLKIKTLNGLLTRS